MMFFLKFKLNCLSKMNGDPQCFLDTKSTYEDVRTFSG